MAYDIHASVDPPTRQVTIGEDASFSCLVSGSDVGNVSISYNWIAHHSVIGDQRFESVNDGQGFRILRTMSAENNTDVTCSVRSKATKQLISSGKSRIVVMPKEIVTPPISPPHDLTGTKGTTDRISTLSSLTTRRQTLTENAGKTSHTGPNPDNEGEVDGLIIGGAAAGVVALLLVFCCAIIVLFRSKKQRDRDYANKASFSGRNYNLDGVPQMKRYVFQDPTSGERVTFSEVSGFVSPEPPPRLSSQVMRTNSRGSAPDILSGCSVDGNTSPLYKQSQKPISKSNESMGHLYESVTPNADYITPSAPRPSVMKKQNVMQFDNHSYTDIIVGSDESESSSDGTMKLEETNNIKNTTNGPPLDRFGYVELNIEPHNLCMSDDEDTHQTILPCVPSLESEDMTTPGQNSSVIYRP